MRKMGVNMSLSNTEAVDWAGLLDTLSTLFRGYEVGSFYGTSLK